MQRNSFFPHGESVRIARLNPLRPRAMYISHWYTYWVFNELPSSVSPIRDRCYPATHGVSSKLPASVSPIRHKCYPTRHAVPRSIMNSGGQDSRIRCAPMLGGNPRTPLDEASEWVETFATLAIHTFKSFFVQKWQSVLCGCTAPVQDLPEQAQE